MATSDAPSVTIADIRAAAERIEGHVVRTPTAHSSTLSEITGADVFVKFENLQFTASYKERGALNRLALLPDDAAGVVAASAGNFAQGVAHHGARLAIPTVIVMPVTTPSIKVSRTAHLGAEIVRFGETFDEARAHAAAVAAERGYELLSPFDDPAVIAGQGTVALELLADVPELDAIVTPVGGGGLQAGIAVAARAQSPGIQLVGVQSERFPAVHNEVTGNDLPVGGSTIAEGIAVATPGERTVAIIRSLVDHVEVVTESLVEEAIGLYLEIEKTVAEGAGAAPLAELLARPQRYRGRRVGLVLTGGNIDLRQLASVTLRGLVRSGRLTTFWVELDDRPGSLGAITTAVGEMGGNIVEVIHRRLDVTMHARSSEVELTVETSDREHASSVLAGLTERGFRVRGPKVADITP
ncbi:MAG: threonine ammonia-lyase [Ilumatobacteraceae bacterium]|nr:threonine ammonia-lyase [Ilumatobacteraceae bacterium]